MTQDLIITWPKARLLPEYLEACAAAKASGEVVNYRVARAPTNIDGTGCRVYVVHYGMVRGWQRLLDVVERGKEEVLDPHTGEWWPPGVYLVRDPDWHWIMPIPMRGFQGWRYFERPA